MSRFVYVIVLVEFLFLGGLESLVAQQADYIREFQTKAIQQGRSDAAYWGWEPQNYTRWGTHTNRLIPVYTFGTLNAGSGVDLSSYTGANSPYRDPAHLTRIYSFLPENTVSAAAEYMDQTNIFDIQFEALHSGRKKNIIWRLSVAIDNKRRLLSESTADFQCEKR